MKLEPFVPLDKQSKKKRRAYHRMKRGPWGQVVPVTRVMKNKKAYDRKERHMLCTPPSGPLLLMTSSNR